MIDLENKMLFSAKEVCQILFGSTDRTSFYAVYGMIERGDLDAKKVGERWYVKRNSLLTWGSVEDDKPTTNL
tara:strand:- start:293 stop:508 length:216 start_codon:yes stop_codon:yes gene_type:complete